MVEDRLQHWIELAISHSATDIHCHFNDKASTLQLRTVNGLQTFASVVEDLLVYQYLKYKSNLDLSISMTPQTGTFEYIYQNKVWYCRFSAMETLSAKSGVLRILNLSPIQRLFDITQDDQLSLVINNLLQKQNGLLLFAGTTGSGKTTTMFTGLNETIQKSIYTLEDPIEKIYEQMMQMQVNQRIGLDFDSGIKQLLRHDPDIIVIGEIRSPQEAASAIRACLSGHLVCATIHSSTPELTLHRLVDLQVSWAQLSMINIDIIFQKLISFKTKRSARFELLLNQEISQYIQKQSG